MADIVIFLPQLWLWTAIENLECNIVTAIGETFLFILIYVFFPFGNLIFVLGI